VAGAFFPTTFFCACSAVLSIFFLFLKPTFNHLSHAYRKKNFNHPARYPFILSAKGK